jgi:hypothetical protein
MPPFFSSEEHRLSAKYSVHMPPFSNLSRLSLCLWPILDDHGWTAGDLKSHNLLSSKATMATLLSAVLVHHL